MTGKMAVIKMEMLKLLGKRRERWQRQRRGEGGGNQGSSGGDGDDGGRSVGFSSDRGSDGKNGDVKRIEDMSAQKLAHDVHSSKTLNSQRVEKIQTSING